MASGWVTRPCLLSLCVRGCVFPWSRPRFSTPARRGGLSLLPSSRLVHERSGKYAVWSDGHLLSRKPPETGLQLEQSSLYFRLNRLRNPASDSRHFQLIFGSWVSDPRRGSEFPGWRDPGLEDLGWETRRNPVLCVCSAARLALPRRADLVSARPTEEDEGGAPIKAQKAPV